MDDLIKALNEGISGVKSDLEKKLDSAIVKHEGQLAESGKASEEIRAEVKALSEQFKREMDELAKRMERTHNPSDTRTKSVAEQFIESDSYKAYAAGNRDRARFDADTALSVKATVESDSTTVFPMQRPGIIPGNFAPTRLRAVIPVVRTTSNAVNHLKESSWTNSAAPVSQGGTKPESAIEFTNANFVIETIAHWTPITEQLAADAPSVVDYINNRLRHGLESKIEAQLITGDGTSPNLSGFTDSGNYTNYSLAASGDNIHDAVSKAKYAMWAATDIMPDTVVLNPADWGAEERTREGTAGMYLFGGLTMAGMQVVLSNSVTSGNFLVMNVQQSSVVFERQGATIEIGRNADDFTRNKLTIRAEERLALAVLRPSLVYYGDFEL